MLQPAVGASGLVYLKEKGKEAYTSSAALTVPGHVSTHRLRTEGGKHTTKRVLDYCGVECASQSHGGRFDEIRKWINKKQPSRITASNDEQ